MTDINSVVIAGRLTKDAITRYSQSGSQTCIVSFTVAVNRSRKRPDGSWGDEPSFIDCKYFGNSAEAVSKYLLKGRQVIVQGELRQSKWESEGQPRSKIEVVANLVSLGQPSREGGQSFDQMDKTQQRQGGNSWQGDQRRSGYEARETRTIMIDEGGPENFADDDIPF